MGSTLLWLIALILCCLPGACGQCGTSPYCSPNATSPGVYDCQSAGVCEITDVPVQNTVLCNHATVSCEVTGVNTNCLLFGGVGGANTTFNQLGKNVSVDCESAPVCTASSTNSGGLSTVNCNNANECYTERIEIVKCGSANTCKVAYATNVTCEHASMCNITQVRDGGVYNCANVGTCTVFGSYPSATAVSVNVSCGSASRCHVESVYSFVLSCQKASVCSGVPQSDVWMRSTAYCTSQAQCSTLPESVEICYNLIGEPSGGCSAVPLLTPSPPPTTPGSTTSVYSAPPETPNSATSLPTILPVLTSVAPFPSPTSPPTSAPPPPTTQAPLPPPPPPAVCINNPPTPNAVCVDGTWFVPPTMVSGGQELSFTSSTQLFGDLVLSQNSTLHIVTVIGAFSTLVEVSGCVRSDNASLVVDVTSEIGDMRSIDLVSTACFSGGFVSTKINTRSTCEKYNGRTFYNGARLSVLLQNNETGCHTQTKYVVLAVILCVLVIVVATVVVVVYCYRERDNQRRLRSRNPNSHYTNILDK